MLVIRNARAVCPASTPGVVRLVEDATLTLSEGRVLSVVPGGPIQTGLPVVDAGGRLVTPGLVDCHTHAWFLGDRAVEFGERMAGVSYLELARRGGGIQSTVRATRAGTPVERQRHLRERLRHLAQQGYTTVEVKSGYGLSADSELTAIDEIIGVSAPELPAVRPTLLAAHAIPPEATSPALRAQWVQTIASRLISEAAAKGAERVDVFVESGAYSVAETEAIAVATRARGLALHLHVDQLSNGGGAVLAARLGAQAVAHLEHVSDEGIAALARAGTVAILIPTATLVTGLDRFAPARKLLHAGVPIALSTNLNPGTAPSESSSLVFFLAATGLKLSPEEILWAATRGGARALGLHDVGLLEPGASADLVIWNARELAHLPYHASVNHVRLVLRQGRVICDRSAASDAECSGSL